jgi:hypothetical protein
MSLDQNLVVDEHPSSEDESLNPEDTKAKVSTIRKNIIDLSKSISDFSLSILELDEICDDAKVALKELHGCTKPNQ